MSELRLKKGRYTLTLEGGIYRVSEGGFEVCSFPEADLPTLTALLMAAEGTRQGLLVLLDDTPAGGEEC